MEAGERRPAPVGTECVHCLECGSVYAKPVSGGAVARNPGCPDCGYVGWIPVTVEAEPRSRRRSGADPPPRLLGRPR